MRKNLYDSSDIRGYIIRGLNLDKLIRSTLKVYLHVWNIFEYEGLVKCGVTVLSVNFSLKLGFFVRKKINLYKWICSAG